MHHSPFGEQWVRNKNRRVRESLASSAHIPHQVRNSFCIGASTLRIFTFTFLQVNACMPVKELSSSRVLAKLARNSENQLLVWYLIATCLTKCQLSNLIHTEQVSGENLSPGIHSAVVD